MCVNPHPHLHCISARLKLGVSISTMSAPADAIKVRRNISATDHKFPVIDFLYSSRILSSSSFSVDLTSFSRSKKTTLMSSFSLKKESAIVLTVPAITGANAAIILLFLDWRIKNLFEILIRVQCYRCEQLYLISRLPF